MIVVTYATGSGPADHAETHVNPVDDETPAETVARMLDAGQMPFEAGTPYRLIDAIPPAPWAIDWATGAITALPPPPPPVPESISDRQFFQGLAVQGLITEDEALAAVATGTIPAAMQAFIAALPEGQRFGARMVLCGAVEFHRSHPLVSAFGQMQGLDAAGLDDLWRFCAAL